VVPLARTPDSDELAAAVEVAAFVSAQPRDDGGARVVAEHAAQRGLLAVHVRWWLADSKWFEPATRRPPRHAWALSPLDALFEVVGWLVPQANDWQLLVPELGRAATGIPSATGAAGGLDDLFGEGRGLANGPREERRRVAEWLAAQDHDELARRARARGAEELGRKAQGVETMFDESGFASSSIRRARCNAAI
jgi:hypothetical protein